MIELHNPTPPYNAGWFGDAPFWDTLDGTVPGTRGQVTGKHGNFRGNGGYRGQSVKNF